MSQMERNQIPVLQKSSSIEIQLESEQVSSPSKPFSRMKTCSLPTIPEGIPNTKNISFPKNLSCYGRYYKQQLQTEEQKKKLQRRVFEIVKEVINDKSKISQLLEVIQTLGNSLKLSAKLSIKDTNRDKDEKFSPLLKMKQKRTSEKLINFSSNLAQSIKLSNNSEGNEEKQPTKKQQICGFLVQSIQLDYVENNSSVSDQLANFSALKSLEQEMLSSLEVPSLNKIYHKISIVLEDSCGSGSDVYSDKTSDSALLQGTPQLLFSQELVGAIFATASPFLVNLSLCFFIKFILRSQLKINEDNAGWLLGIAAIIGYKIFYDETLQGIIDYFSSVLSISRDKITSLERWFLKQLNYELLVENKHYMQIMLKLAQQTI